LVEPIGHKAREKNEGFLVAYNKMLNKFIKEFSADFCSNSGEIDWEKLLEYNSGK